MALKLGPFVMSMILLMPPSFNETNKNSGPISLGNLTEISVRDLAEEVIRLTKSKARWFSFSA